MHERKSLTHAAFSLALRRKVRKNLFFSSFANSTVNFVCSLSHIWLLQVICSFGCMKHFFPTHCLLASFSLLLISLPHVLENFCVCFAVDIHMSDLSIERISLLNLQLAARSSFFSINASAKWRTVKTRPLFPFLLFALSPSLSLSLSLPLYFSFSFLFISIDCCILIILSRHLFPSSIAICHSAKVTALISFSRHTCPPQHDPLAVRIIFSFATLHQVTWTCEWIGRGHCSCRTVTRVTQSNGEKKKKKGELKFFATRPSHWCVSFTASHK